MIRRVWAATRLVVRVQARGYFPHVYGYFAAFSVAVLLWVVPDGAAEQLLPAFIVSEPGVIGLTMVAAHRYLELGNRSVSALHVSPLRPGEYLAALLLGSALLGTVAGGATMALVAGFDGRLLWLLPILFAFALLSGLLGFALALRYRDFPRFLLGMMPLTLLWQAPLLAVYGVVPAPVVLWIPSAPGVLGIGALCLGEPGNGVLAALTLAGFAVTAAGFVWVLRSYTGYLHAGLEPA